ncbi:MAG: uroporphyrinogen decarboxylase family protein [Leptospira sp.]|nr:uroporphyrinogen decarboxylase family protein [Leptospira sp.]
MINPRFSNAIQQIPQSIPPIWFMRQAGRYHSHYRKLKEKYSFLELCKKPELAAEVALGPVKEFGFDVSILFSDLLFPLEALGMNLEYAPGPKLSFNIQNINQINNLLPIEEAISKLEFQKSALQLTREILPKDVSLIGFIGGPWTLFTYAAEGKHDGNLKFAKSHPILVEAFYEKIIPLLKKNITLQMEGGAEIVMIFDTAAGELDFHSFHKYVIGPLKLLCENYPGRIGYYAKGTTEIQMSLLKSVNGLSGFGIDHRFDLSSMLLDQNRYGFLQGNFDQSLLFMEREDLTKALDIYLKPILSLSKLERKGWVAGLGHGILQFTPEDSVKLIIDTIRERCDVN